MSGNRDCTVLVRDCDVGLHYKWQHRVCSGISAGAICKLDRGLNFNNNYNRQYNRYP